MTTQVGVSVRFVPAGIYTPEGSKKQVLRGAVVFMPDQDGVLDLETWPRAVDDALPQLKVFWRPVSTDLPSRLVPGGTATPATALTALYDSANVRAAVATWNRLMAPDLGNSKHAAEISLLKSTFTQSPILQSAYTALTQPWDALAAAVKSQATTNRTRQLFRTTPADATPPSPDAVPRVSSAPLAKTAQLLNGLDCVRGIDSLCRALGSPNGMVLEQPRTSAARGSLRHQETRDLRRLRWMGVPHLFSPQREPIPEPSASDWASWTLPRVAARGLKSVSDTAAGLYQAIKERPDSLSKSHRRFLYLAPPPFPIPQLTPLLMEKIRSSIQAHKDIAASTFRRTTQFLNFGLNPSELAARRSGAAARTLRAIAVWLSGPVSADRRPSNAGAARVIYGSPTQAIARALWPRPLGPAPARATGLAELHDTVQTAMAMHLIDIRPDDVRDLTGIRIHPAAGTAITPAALEEFSRNVAAAPQRRLFGLLAYPALARVLRLIVDVEFELPSSDQLSHTLTDGRGAYFFWLRASVTLSSETLELWTAAKLRFLRDPHFGVCTKEELEITALGLRPARGDDQPNPPQFEGIVTLSGNYDGSGPRFALENLDVVSRIEQYLNAGESEANAEQSGQSLQHPGSGVGPARTAGIVVHDRGRAAALTTQLAKTVNEAKKPPNDPRPVFADDLNVGFRTDVAVVGRLSKQLEWRSLGDRWVAFNDTEIEHLVKSTLDIARPRLRNFSAQDFRLQLDALNVKFPSRIIVQGQPSLDDSAKLAQAAALEIVLQWTGSPLGAPPADGVDESPPPGLVPPSRSVQVDPATDLPLGVTLEGVSKGQLGKQSALPPWLEFGRGYRLGMRAVCFGGISVSMEEAIRIYGTVKDVTIPPTQPNRAINPDDFHVFRRHEPVSAPVVALLYQGRDVPPKDPRGDTLTGIVVRSRNGKPNIAQKYAPTPRSVRVVYVRGVPMSFAALHPIQPRNDGSHGMALHGLRTLSGRHGIVRLCGGFQFVALDSESGGLPIGWQGSEPRFPPRAYNSHPVAHDVAGEKNDSVFWVHWMSNDRLADRKAQYFPDPAVSALVIEAHAEGPRAGPPEMKMIPIYDSHMRQAITHEPFERHSEPATFPHAMPVLLDVNAVTQEDAGTMASVFDDLTIGAIQENGTFSQFAAGAETSTTATRVRINLAPGQTVRLRIWCYLLPEVIRDWFEFSEHALLLASTVGGSGDQPNPRDAIAGIRTMFSATQRLLGTLGLDAGFSPQQIDHLHANVAELREFVAAQFAKALKRAPIAGLSDGITLTATHAILQSRFPPMFVRRDSAGALIVCTKEDDNPVGLLRHTFKTPDRWTKWLQAPAHRDVNQWRQWRTAKPPGDDASDFHQESAVLAWFGGIAAVDLETTSQLILRASYLDVNDDPTAWPTDNNPLKPDGTPPFGLTRLELFRTADLQKETSHEMIPDGQGHHLDLIDLLQASDGTVRALSWQFQDSRARRLKLHYVAISRFWNYFVDQGQLQNQPPDKRPALPAAFELEGDSRIQWLPSTKRPDPIAKIEFLPAFVYVTESCSTQRSRHVRARLRMRRAKSQDGGWFSSGEGEQLAVILWPPDLFNPSSNTNVQDNIEDGTQERFSTTNFDLGVGGKYVSRWGSDPIRVGGEAPSWLIPRRALEENLRAGSARFVDYLDPGVDTPSDHEIKLNPVLMPVPTPDSNSTALPINASPIPPMPVCLLCFDPIYDPVENLWYVDIAVDPGLIAAPFVRLGVARFQEHSLRGLEVSEPTTIQFRLEPYRRIQVYARAKAPGDPGWPIEIRVSGPSSVVAGGRRSVDGPEPAQKDYQTRRMPHFDIHLLHDGHEYLDNELHIDRQSETDPVGVARRPAPPSPSDYDPPADDEIWRATVYSPMDPTNHYHPHDVVIIEVDMMLNASIKHIEDSDLLVPTGPRFATKIRVHGLSSRPTEGERRPSPTSAGPGPQHSS